MVLHKIINNETSADITTRTIAHSKRKKNETS